MAIRFASFSYNVECKFYSSDACFSLSPIKRKSIMASEHTIVGDNLLLDQTTQSLFQQVFTTGKEIEPKQNVFTQ